MSQAFRSGGFARWMRPLPLLASACLMVGCVAAAAAETPVSPEGIWYTRGQESIIRVHPCASAVEAFCGTLVWLKDPNEADGTPKVDKLNRDPTKKGKPMLGTDILLRMTPDSDRWRGHAYNPEDGKIYDITFHVKTETEENDTADLRGCVLGFLCQTEKFTRAREVPGGDPTADAGGKKIKLKKDTKASAHR